VTGFDRIVCEYPLSDPHDQDREFVTRDFGGWGRDRYLITRNGRLIRQAPLRRQGLEPVRDVEWPVEGEIRMVDDDVTEAEDPVEYAVRFTGGRVEWIRRVRMDAGAAAVEASARGAMIPERMPVLFLLTTIGLRRVAALVGREGWLAAVEDEG
jgi:hypothetical protein